MEQGSRVDVELATRQVKAGHPVWIPPDNCAECISDILQRFCGVTLTITKYALKNAAIQRIDSRWMLPRLTPKDLASVFNLTIGQQLLFTRSARWIIVMDELAVAVE
jgi:hypothetical protein